MANETIDDVSSSVGDPVADEPVIVMVATGTTPTAVVIPVRGTVMLRRELTKGKHGADGDDQRMSAEHATVRRERGAWKIADNNSRNGTHVDGIRIEREVVKTGDLVLRLGSTVFVLVVDGRGYESRLPDGLIVVGPELARTYDHIRRIAHKRTVLIQGETGTGKELAAKVYHKGGPRTDGPFVPVSCPSIPKGLAESMLFGTRKGAYTQAENTPGAFQAAHGGTLFLDEIADLPLDVQPTFLRSLEDRTVQPLGATTPIPVEIGVVAASHGHLRALVAERKFRDDLYYRLADTTIHLPPLRARKVDIARLTVRAIAATDHKLVAHPKLIEACCSRPWPGNVRELLGKVGNAATAALVAGRDVVKLEDLEPTSGMYVVSAEHETAQDKPRALRAQGDVTKDEVLGALDSTKNNVAQAARKLRVHRNTLNRLIKSFGIKRNVSDDDDDDDDGNDGGNDN